MTSATLHMTRKLVIYKEHFACSIDPESYDVIEIVGVATFC